MLASKGFKGLNLHFSDNALRKVGGRDGVLGQGEGLNCNDRSKNRENQNNDTVS